MEVRQKPVALLRNELLKVLGKVTVESRSNVVGTRFLPLVDITFHNKKFVLLHTLHKNHRRKECTISLIVLR